MLLTWAEECLVGRHGRHLVVTTDGCPVSFFGGVRQARSCPSITSKTAWWFDRGDGIEIGFHNPSPCFRGWRVAQSLRHCVPPCGAFRLHNDQLGGRVIPPLRTGAAVGGAAVTDDGFGLLAFVAGAITRLTFGVAERPFSPGLLGSWADLT